MYNEKLSGIHTARYVSLGVHRDSHRQIYQSCHSRLCDRRFAVC
jgi:hypothetical protein